MKELKILYLYPDILELYGDFGNIQVLKYRLEKLGINLNLAPVVDVSTNSTDYIYNRVLTCVLMIIASILFCLIKQYEIFLMKIIYKGM